ncbi:MAG: diguanylate cyclase [Gammaproteobacteria bacterium]|nr:diguanylate cyclase [Gammaproteobacteria bacterium]
MNILVADDELAIRSLVAELLEDEGHNVTLAEDGQDALEKFKVDWHDIIFSDIRMPKLTGIELLEQVKKINETTQFIIMTSFASVDNSIAALKKGAFDYILKPFEDLDIIAQTANRAVENINELRKQQYLLNTLSRRNTELDGLNQKFREMAIRDGLTGLFNHRHAEERLSKEFERANQFERSLAVLFIDIDHFKLLNDTHGHQAGDEILESIGHVLNEHTRESDTVGRWGGEEFIVIAPETDEQEASALAENVREAVSNGTFPYVDQQPGGHLSMSIGVATNRDDVQDAVALVGDADKALYRAKETGRNRTVVCRGDDDMEDIAPR